MTPLQLIALGAMLILTGIALAVRAVRPPPPHLRATLAALAGQPTTTATTADGSCGGVRRRWMPVWLADQVSRHVGAADADLAILERDRDQLAVAKLAWAVGAALVPFVFALIPAAAGWQVPVTIPLIGALGLAVFGWVNPSRQLAQDAQAARAAFRAAMAAFLALVGLERKARGSPTEALEEASRVSGTAPFRMIHAQVLRAELAGQPPWDALRELGVRVGVDELVSLADIVATAADGAAVFDTLLAEARSLRHADAIAQQEQAATATERLVLPMTCLFFCFGALLVYPAVARLTATG